MVLVALTDPAFNTLKADLPFKRAESSRIRGHLILHMKPVYYFVIFAIAAYQPQNPAYHGPTKKHLACQIDHRVATSL
jgi:hypothetical protein